MGVFINVCSGAGPGTLPASHVTSILYNVPDAIRNETSIRKTRELIEMASPRVLFQDSGGFQIHQAIANGFPIMFDPKKEVYHGGILNVTPEHLIKAAKIFKPDVMIGLDNPIPRTTGSKDPAREHINFLRHHGFNLRWARETAQLKNEHLSETTLFLPIQAYTLQQLRAFMEDLGDTQCDGFCVPVRNHSPTEIALYLLQLYHYGARKVHVLGTFTFRAIALSAYVVRHFFDFLSLDSTSWRSDAEYSKYYLPHDLRSIMLRNEYRIDESLSITCSCPWCKNLTFTEIKNLPYSERNAFLRRHNYWVIEQAMRDFYDHADTAETLTAYLSTVSGRNTEIAEIYCCLTGIEIIKDCLSDEAIEILYNVIC